MSTYDDMPETYRKALRAYLHGTDLALGIFIGLCAGVPLGAALCGLFA